MSQVLHARNSGSWIQSAGLAVFLDRIHYTPAGQLFAPKGPRYSGRLMFHRQPHGSLKRSNAQAGFHRGWWNENATVFGQTVKKLTFAIGLG